VGFLAALILAAQFLQHLGLLTASITVEHYHDLGKLLFGFVFFWGYIAFSQYMLMWYANIPEETGWYLIRQTDGWAGVSLVLLFGHLLLPFLGLLSRHVRRNRIALAGWALWLLVMHWIDLYWLVMPQFSESAGPTFGWIDLCCLVGLGAAYVSAVLWAAADRALIPVKDPRLLESLAFRNA
ncbi:MAG: quinol:cytochrome C oxidoreductase, partial [Planctomycetes bacterium]|nr:quinol:cytochrome C oxidoreductase [Planctomycetota bacterium]